MVKSKLIKYAQTLIQQPLEGLLYDMDLLPEQRKMKLNDMRGFIVEELYKQREQARKDLKKFGSHKARCDMTFHGADYCSCGFEQALVE